MTKVKKGQQLPDTDHVVRHVPWTRLRKDEDENVIGILPQALKLRDEEEALSVDWLECFDGIHEDRIRQAVVHFRSLRTIGPKSGFSIGNVGNIKRICNRQKSSIRIIYAPSKSNSAHSLIQRLPREDMAVLEALATEVFVDFVLNNTIV